MKTAPRRLAASPFLRTTLVVVALGAVGLAAASSAHAQPEPTPSAPPQVAPAVAPGVAPGVGQAIPVSTLPPAAPPATTVSPDALRSGGPAGRPATAPRPPVLAASGVDPTLSMSDDDLVRTIARLNTRRDVLKALSALDDAQASRQLAQIQDQINVLVLREKLAAGGRDPSKEGPSTPPSAAGVGPAVMAAPEVRPVVRSIYGYGGTSYAEIYVGSAKIVATQGTVLATGDAVVDISPAGVVLEKKGKRTVLQVAGSAGITPVSVLPAPGLPPRP